jgi:hypothetical protein
MAASVVKRDTDGARNGHDKPGRQQVKPDRSSRRKYLHHLEFNLTEGPQENGTVLPKTKKRTKIQLSTGERAEESKRSVSSVASYHFIA